MPLHKKTTVFQPVKMIKIVAYPSKTPILMIFDPLPPFVMPFCNKLQGSGLTVIESKLT